MPEMYEIYEKYADRYDKLIRAEDHRDNLRHLLHETAGGNIEKKYSSK
ncbi:hypothetical protein ES708_17179 [subsurface metagenome]